MAETLVALCGFFQRRRFSDCGGGAALILRLPDPNDSRLYELGDQSGPQCQIFHHMNGWANGLVMTLWCIGPSGRLWQPAEPQFQGKRETVGGECGACGISFHSLPFKDTAGVIIYLYYATFMTSVCKNATCRSRKKWLKNVGFGHLSKTKGEKLVVSK